MNLRNIHFKISYRSNVDDLLKDFYIPAFSNSTEYCRASGFFSSNLLNNLGKGIYPFIVNDGRMRLICGIHLSKDDLDEINKGYSIKEKLLEEKVGYALTRSIDEISSSFLTTDLSNICWMIANNRLNIKIAINSHNGLITSGIYHEKIAIFCDSFNNFVATNGSSNESEYGYVYNFEYFDVYKSWGSNDEVERINEKMQYFSDMWVNKTDNLVVMNFPDAIRQQLVKMAPEIPIDHNGNVNKFLISEAPDIYSDIKLRPWKYQEKAINEWFRNNNKGIFEMATGTGKTYTSLFAVKKYIARSVSGYVLVICCPYQHLVSQWEQNVKDVFPTADIVKCFDNKKIWLGPLNKLVQDIIFGNQLFGVVITTTSTGSSEDFFSILNTPKIRRIIICDEVHNIGSEQNKNFLKLDSEAKIGLSATPIRPFDEEGNRAIREYFGDSIYKLSIKEAIEMGFLVQYNYYIRYCELDELEYEEYRNISMEIAKLYSTKSKLNEEKLQRLLLKRARILSSCTNKLKVFDEILGTICDYHNLLVYTAENPSFLNDTLKVLNKRNIVTLKITSDVCNDVRKEIIGKFSNEDIHCILAMRCLDEGVDIPTANKAIILASSTNAKQYIQRRGRVLRKDKKGKKRVADIYDILILPPEFVNDIDKNLFERELVRVLEFASTARNSLQIISQLISFSRENSLMKNFINIFKEYTL